VESAFLTAGNCSDRRNLVHGTKVTGERRKGLGGGANIAQKGHHIEWLNLRGRHNK
jgi:hypothetical protein